MQEVLNLLDQHVLAVDQLMFFHITPYESTKGPFPGFFQALDGLPHRESWMLALWPGGAYGAINGMMPSWIWRHPAYIETQNTSCLSAMLAELAPGATSVSTVKKPLTLHEKLQHVQTRWPETSAYFEALHKYTDMQRFVVYKQETLGLVMASGMPMGWIDGAPIG